MIAESTIYSNGQWDDLGAPSGATSLDVDGLDDAGQVLAGAYLGSGASAAYHLFLYTSGQWTDLNVPSEVNSFYSPQINASGQVMANVMMGSGSSAANHPFLFSHGQWSDLGVPSGDLGWGIAINSSGQVVARIDTDTSTNGSQPYLYSNGQWTDLGVPSGYTDLYVDSIDSAGEVLAAGVSGNGDSFASHLLLYSGGQWLDLNNFLPAGSLGAPSWAHINANGQISVSASDGQAYLLTPQQTSSVATTTSLSVSSTNVPAGQAVTLTATVSNTGSLASITPGSVTFSGSVVLVTGMVTDSPANPRTLPAVPMPGSPANTIPGSVTFFDGSTVLGTVMLTDGTARLTTTLPVGSNNITAVYNGFTQGGLVYNPSTSAVQTVTVSSPSGSGGSTPPTEAGNPVAGPVSAPTPVGNLSLLGLGFAPGWQLDVFEVDQAGQVFAVPWLSFFEGTAQPSFVNSDVVLSNTQLFDGSLVSFLHGSNGQPYVMDVLATNTTYLAEAMADAALNHR
jgi:hypothetical protein